MNNGKVVSLKKFSVSDRHILNKKLVPSTRYAKIKAKTNSGFNASKKQEVEKELRKYYKIRSDEVFRRISLVDLIQLILIYAEENNTEKLAAFDEDVKSLHFKNKIEERESLTLHESNEEPVCPFLILDVRSEAEFNRGHLVTAVSYPHSGLSRAFCWESKIMLLYKNHPEWIIIICDENESLSPGVATTLIHRGYSNSFMLSGGLKLAQDKIGSPLITTDKNQILTSEAAEILCEMLSSTIIPSVGLHGPLDWWTDKSAESVKYDKEQ